jgi:hypothetical protein
MLQCNKVFRGVTVMSIRDRQIELGKNLFQINANTLRGLAELGRDNVEKYFELNASYWEKLPEVGGFTGFVELQREYNESMWEGVKESAQSQADLFKDALEESGDALKAAFAQEEEEEEVASTPAKKTKKAKIGAKKVEVEVKPDESLPH